MVYVKCLGRDNVTETDKSRDPYFLSLSMELETNPFVFLYHMTRQTWERGPMKPRLQSLPSSWTLFQTGCRVRPTGSKLIGEGKHFTFKSYYYDLLLYSETRMGH